MEDSLAAGDPSLLDERFDIVRIARAATKDVEVPHDFANGFFSGLGSVPGFGTQILTSTEGEVQYTFLRMLDDERALFRLLSDNGLNYHELYLARDDGGRVRIDDAFIYLIGENYSDMMRRTYVSVAAEADRGILARVFGEDTGMTEALSKVDEIQTKAATDPAAALALINSLSDYAKKTILFLAMRMQIASLVRRLPTTQQFSRNTPTTIPRTISSFATSIAPPSLPLARPSRTTRLVPRASRSESDGSPLALAQGTLRVHSSIR